MDADFNDGAGAYLLLSKLQSYTENIMLEDIKRQAEDDPDFNGAPG